MDEVTSSVNTETEKLIQNALENLKHNKTTVVITHRLSTSKNADEIIVLKEDQIVERGTHKELLKAKGLC